MIELDLSHNQILELDEFSFADLSKLTFLNLMGNEINTLSGRCSQVIMFQKSIVRIVVLLSNQFLITDHVFFGLSSLRILNLSDNKFTSVPVSPLLQTPSLTDLNMDFNNIVTLHLFHLTMVKIFKNVFLNSARWS